ncbi:MAG: argininosuccinate synthase [Oscillospiraceae bacterium]|nr:argininosuccinate synthase [Oscillospiraceae bacterium]
MKIVLAYSGGLDTTIIIPWLKENYAGCEVICMAANVGQDSELELVELVKSGNGGLEERAYRSGADKFYMEDIQEEFVTDFIFPMLKMSARYENYLLGTAISRPVIAKRLVEIALRENADSVCHGCTGKGNDQVRFELAIKALAPELDIIAPWRIWNIRSREEAIEYAEARNLPLNVTRENNYSKDMNLWHLSHEGLDLEDLQNEPIYNKDGFLELGVSPENAPAVPAYITIGFDKGVPISLNGAGLNGVELIKKLNQIGGENGIGLLDIVENRLVGIKSRGVYETPGGTILYFAHEALEAICLDRETAHYKAMLSVKYADVVYNGQWYTPLREALDAFVNKTQERVTGEVRLKLYKGNIIKAGLRSPYSLYDEDTASFGEVGEYNVKDAEGFINIFGLPIKSRAILDKEQENNND